MTEFGWGMFKIWKFIFMDPPPLSPPILSQIFPDGMIDALASSLPNLHEIIDLLVVHARNVCIVTCHFGQAAV